MTQEEIPRLYSFISPTSTPISIHQSTKMRNSSKESPDGGSSDSHQSQLISTFPIYLNDVLSFLTRRQLEQCREVSRQLNHTVCAIPPSKLQRHRLYGIKFLEDVSFHLSGPLLTALYYIHSRHGMTERNGPMYLIMFTRILM